MQIFDLTDFEDQDDEEADESDESQEIFAVSVPINGTVILGLVMNDRENTCTIVHAFDCYFGYDKGSCEQNHTDRLRGSYDVDYDAINEEQRNTLLSSQIGYL